jgi:putative ABC transport system permease protein
VSAILLVRSYDNLTHVDTGFTSAGVYTFHVGARWNEDRQAVGHLQERLVEEIGRQPGVTAVGLANFLPQSGASLRYQVKVAGVPGTDPNGYVTAGSRSIGADYFKALNIPIVAGTACPSFRSREAAFDPNTMAFDLVNRRFVSQFANGENVVGRSLRMAQYPQTAHTIIGVVGDVSEDSAAADVVPYVYSCLSAGDWPDPEYVVRLSAPASFTAALRPLVRNLDSSRAVFGYQPLEDVLRTDTEEPRMDAGLTTLFAATALGLSAIGLYGLFMLIVSESRREIGVRLALGAAPRQMIGLVCVGAGRLLVAGLAIGLLLTAGAGRILRTLLFGISAHDAGTMALATVALATVSLAAILLPALRASRVPPTEALRE